jgi:hypothetical protein
MSLFTSEHGETDGEGGEAPVDIKQRRSAVLSPAYPQLTEETLLKLEQSLPNYRLAQRNLNHWFYYIEATVKDTFDTFRDLPDRDFHPGAFDSPLSVLSLSQAHFQESHHSPAGSSDLFGFTVRSPCEIQVVISSRAQSAAPSKPPSVEPSVSKQPSIEHPNEAPRSPLLASPEDTLSDFFQFDPEPQLQPPFEPILFPSRPSSSGSDSPRSHGALPSRPSPSQPPRRLTRLRPRHKRRKAIDFSSVEIIEIPDSSESENVS